MPPQSDTYRRTRWDPGTTLLIDSYIVHAIKQIRSWLHILGIPAHARRALWLSLAQAEED